MLRPEEKKRKDGKKPARRTIEGVGAVTLGLWRNKTQTEAFETCREMEPLPQEAQEGKASKSLSVVVVALEPSTF